MATALMFRQFCAAELDRLVAPPQPRWEIGGLLRRTSEYYFARARGAVACARLLWTAAKWDAEIGGSEACELAARALDRLTASLLWREAAKRARRGQSTGGITSSCT